MPWLTTSLASLFYLELSLHFSLVFARQLSMLTKNPKNSKRKYRNNEHWPLIDIPILINNFFPTRNDCFIANCANNFWESTMFRRWWWLAVVTWWVRWGGAQQTLNKSWGTLFYSGVVPSCNVNHVNGTCIRHRGYFASIRNTGALVTILSCFGWWWWLSLLVVVSGLNTYTYSARGTKRRPNCR